MFALAGLLLGPLGWIKSILKGIISTEIGRILLAVAVAYFIGHWRGSSQAETVCLAKMEQSRQAAASIDEAALKEQLKRKEQDALAAEARATAQAGQLEELKNAVRDDCPLGDNADLLNRLR